MSQALLAVGLTILLVLWHRWDSKHLEGRVNGIYARCFTPDELDRIGRNLDGTERSSDV